MTAKQNSFLFLKPKPDYGMLVMEWGSCSFLINHISPLKLIKLKMYCNDKNFTFFKKNIFGASLVFYWLAVLFFGKP